MNCVIVHLLEAVGADVCALMLRTVPGTFTRALFI